MGEFNVLEHELVPSHSLLSEKEAQAVLKKYGITREQLPKIRLGDPCIRTLEEALRKDIEEGRIVKIVRRSDVAGVCEAYRLVVRG
ncbi:MAG: DNA-directed RNA polymerase subunit H [Candidatus Thermoplasmatota archaeon]